MSLYPTLEELADVNIDYFMEDRESVMFRRTNGKIGVCAKLYMGGNVYCKQLDWKAIKAMANYKVPNFSKVAFCLNRKRYFMLLRQNAFLREQAKLPPYREEYYLPNDEENEDAVWYETRASNFSLAGSLYDPVPPIEEVTNLDDDDDSVVGGRWLSFRKWFARIRDRMRR